MGMHGRIHLRHHGRMHLVSLRRGKGRCGCGGEATQQEDDEEKAGEVTHTVFRLNAFKVTLHAPISSCCL